MWWTFWADSLRPTACARRGILNLSRRTELWWFMGIKSSGHLVLSGWLICCHKSPTKVGCLDGFNTSRGGPRVFTCPIGGESWRVCRWCRRRFWLCGEFSGGLNENMQVIIGYGLILRGRQYACVPNLLQVPHVACPIYSPFDWLGVFPKRARASDWSCYSSHT